ncbi:MAG: histidinol dehydrogenase, partial [Actinomycetota bacterium]
MRVLEITGPITQDQIRDALPRASVSVEKALETVLPLIQDVKINSLSAILNQAERFDGVRTESVRVPQSTLDSSVSQLSPELRAAIETAIERVRNVSLAGVPQGFEVSLGEGALVSQRYVPVDSVGLYVPGGK